MTYNQKNELRTELKGARNCLLQALAILEGVEGDDEEAEALFDLINSLQAQTATLFLRVDVQCIVRCVSDRYPPVGETYPSVNAFLCMCKTEQGEIPTLTQKADGWYDDRKQRVLVVANP